MVKYLTTTEYADLMNLHPVTVRKLCEEGKLRATKDSSRWRIPFDDSESANVAVFEEHARAARVLLEEIDRFSIGVKRAVTDYEQTCKKLGALP